MRKQMTTRELRKAFWVSRNYNGRIPGKSQNDYNAFFRTAWCDFVDECYRNGDISETVANNATL